jgi:hypothetical protein
VVVAKLSKAGAVALLLLTLVLVTIKTIALWNQGAFPGAITGGVLIVAAVLVLVARAIYINRRRS